MAKLKCWLEYWLVDIMWSEIAVIKLIYASSMYAIFFRLILLLFGLYCCVCDGELFVYRISL